MNIGAGFGDGVSSHKAREIGDEVVSYKARQTSSSRAKAMSLRMLRSGNIGGGGTLRFGNAH